MTPVFSGFDDQADVLKTFEDYDYSKTPHEVPIADAEHIEVLFAVLDSASYEECAFVLFRDKRDGELYTIEASHCSCNGFEGQWCPVKTTVPALILMLDGKWYPGWEEPHAAELRIFLAGLVSEI